MRKLVGMWSWLGWAVAIAAGAAVALVVVREPWFVVRGRLAADTSGVSVTAQIGQWIPLGIVIVCALLVFFSRRGRTVFAIGMGIAGLTMIIVGFTPQPPALVEVEMGPTREISQSMTAFPMIYAGAGAWIAVMGLLFALKPGRDRVSGALEVDGWRVIERGPDPTLP